jgi:hypothetical protein
MPAMPQTNLKSGFRASIYEGKFTKMPDFNELKPVRSRIVQSIDYKVAGRDSFFAIIFEGYILIPADGVYGLFINSDDGSKLVIDNKDTIVNDGIHGMREEGKHFPLAAGYHKVRIEYFQGEGGAGLEFLTEAPGREKAIVSASWLYN